MKKILKLDQKKKKKLTKHINTYSRKLKNMRRKIIIEIKLSSLKMIYAIHGK